VCVGAAAGVTREDDAGAEGVVQLGGPEAAGVERARDEPVEGPEVGELGPVAGGVDPVSWTPRFVDTPWLGRQG
jgi:hypothetical protein